MKTNLDSIILTRQELKIMKVVWELGQATVRDVWEVLNQKKPTAYTTILTIMGILEDKGALSHTRAGRAYVYRPMLTRQQATRNHVRDVVVRFFDGKPEKLIESIIKNDFKGSEEPGSLRNLLEMQKSNFLNAQG